MAGRVHYLRGDISKRQHLAIVDRFVRECDIRVPRKNILSAGLLGQRSTRRKMVGMDVRIDHEVNAHPGRFRCTQIMLNVANRVDDGSSRPAPTSEEVGDADRALMQELTKDPALHSSSWHINIQSFC
jgi:hypothetical protein